MPYNQQPYQYNDPSDPYLDVGGSDPMGGFNLGQGLQSLWGSFINRFRGGKWDRTMPQGPSFDITSGYTPYTSPKMPIDISPSFGERMEYETARLPGPSGLWGKGQRQFASEQGMEAGRGLLPVPKGTYKGTDYKDFPALKKEIMGTRPAEFAQQTLRTTQPEFLTPLAEAGESVPGADPNLFQRMGLKYKRGGWGGEAPSSEALKAYFTGTQPEMETAGILEDFTGIPASKDFTPGASSFKSLGDRLQGRRIMGEGGLQGTDMSNLMGDVGEFATPLAGPGQDIAVGGQGISDIPNILKGEIGKGVSGLIGTWGGGGAAYTGSSAQNTQLMGMMKEMGGEGVSIVDALKSAGMESDFGARGALFGKMTGGGAGTGIKGMISGVGSKLGSVGTALGTLGSMASTAMPYIQAGMMIAGAVAGHGQAKRERGLIRGQERQLKAAGQSLEDLYGQRSDIYRQQFGEQLGQASYGAGETLLDVSQTGESVGFTGLSYSGTVSRRLERAREGVRKQFGFSKTGLENILGEKMMGLEEWKAGQKADIASELERLKYQRKGAESRSDWNPFT